jgi:LCP family protein required for cell wall assembly
MVKGVRVRHRKHMRHWWQWALIALFTLVTVLASYGAYRYYKLQHIMQDPGIPVDAGNIEIDPFNVLLVGSDSREGLTEQEQLDLGANAVGGERADTLILAHVDPANDKVIMMQFPRDLWVPLPDKGENKINSALSYGRAYLVRTVKELTGLPIHRYVQVNIAGFRDVVDAIGGVDICITEPVPFDPHTGIEITEDELGMVHFDGDRAIRFVRSRNFTTGDFERIRNQQRFLAAALDKVTSSSTLLRPSRLLKLADAAGDNVRTDAKTTPLGLKNLAERFRNFDPEHYEAYVAPNFGVGNINGISVVLPDMDGIKFISQAIADNKSPAEADGVPDIEPSTISVGVYNGTFQEGRASEAATALKEATDVGEGPVRIAEVANADNFKYRSTVIRYDESKPETQQMAELIAAAVPGAEVEAGKTRGRVDVAVIVGRQKFETKKIVQIVPIPLPKPSDAPGVCK